MKLLHELIMEFAASFPEKAAAEDEDGRLTYAELDSRSSSAASALAALGFCPGDAAAVYVPYSKDILLGAVSVLKAGGFFVPFDDSYPVQRLEYMLDNCNAGAVLTVRELWEKQPLRFPEDRVLFLDEQPERKDPPPRCKRPDENSPAMLLYTSGTTGRPKGVPHSHSFLLHMVDFMNVHEGGGMNADTRSGVMGAFPFVGAQMFLIGPLVHGGTVCIVPDEARKDLRLLYRFLCQKHITHFFIPSALGCFLIEEYDISGILVFAGGEKMRPFRPLVPGNFLINIYGSTETSAVISKKVFGNEPQITVGKPWFNTRTRLVDESLRDVRPGEMGEVLISNGYMARQYYGNPELSEGKWVETGGETWFRIGDRARYTADGDLVIFGRTDNMIKLRGFRIETGEVEAQITCAAEKLGCGFSEHVVVKKTVSGSEHLCCYYEAKQEADTGAIKEEISRNLTDYMVPDIWIRMDALPRNPNGKVLRSELPQPGVELNTFGTLDNEIVARVVWTASDVLNVRGMISPGDRFTSLGGTSLTASLLVFSLRNQGIRISASQVLKLNSLREIAEKADVIREQLWTPEEYQKIQDGFAEYGEHIQKVLPVSPWQDDMLFDQILHPDWIGFKKAILVQVDSIISESCMREALDILASENEELRSAIVYHGVPTVQQVITDRKIPLEMVDTAVFGKREMDDLRRRVLNMPMDLQYSSLMRMIAVHTDQGTFLCMLTHCIAFGMQKRRAYLARLMGLLEKRYPDDASIRAWREILEKALSAEQGRPQPHEEKKTVPDIRAVPPEIYVYSENKGPKLVFIHTGNTGSEAYYRLAERIRDQVSFAVIEPFNLYHPDQAGYGIRRIAARYIEILKRRQPRGPYLLGGWCYGGVVAHEMACQLEQAGEEVRHLFLLDAHAMDSENLVALSRGMYMEINREYFETCPLFADLRANGMLDSMVANAAHVSEDMMAHIPSFYHGNVTYFKPMQIPAGAGRGSRGYWETMMEYAAGNYENYCLPEKLRIVPTPHEHDLMMDGASLEIIVPELLNALGIGTAG